jgi:GNAT superfamily N-acetyltransferase
MNAFNPIRSLSAEDSVSKFNSGEPELDNWLANRALKAEAARTARTYISTVNPTGNIAGYYTVSATSVARDSAGGGWLTRNTPTEIPAILLGRLAIDAQYQGCKLGSALLKDAIWRTSLAADLIGVRALIVDALNEDITNFYLHFGFRQLQKQPLRLFLPIKDIIPNDGSGLR